MGKQRQSSCWSRREVNSYKKDIRAALATLDMLPDFATEKTSSPIEVHNPVYLESEHSGCWYPKTQVGGRIEKNQLLGTVKNFFGDTLEEYYAQSDGIVLYQTVSLSVALGTPLVACAEIIE